MISKKIQQRSRVIRRGRRRFVQHTEGKERQEEAASISYFLTILAVSMPMIFRPISLEWLVLF